MKRIHHLIRNIYRVLITTPAEKRHFVLKHESNSAEDFDCFLRTIVQQDESAPQASSELRDLLEKRVASKRPSALSENALPAFLIPIFTLKHLEFKMIVLTLAFMVTLGIGPTGNHVVNRNLNPVFFADTLIDSSRISVKPAESEF